MKKVYTEPRIEVVEIEIEDAVLANSVKGFALHAADTTDSGTWNW